MKRMQARPGEKSAMCGKSRKIWQESNRKMRDQAQKYVSSPLRRTGQDGPLELFEWLA